MRAFARRRAAIRHGQLRCKPPRGAAAYRSGQRPRGCQSNARRRAHRTRLRCLRAVHAAVRRLRADAHGACAARRGVRRGARTARGRCSDVRSTWATSQSPCKGGGSLSTQGAGRAGEQAPVRACMYVCVFRAARQSDSAPASCALVRRRRLSPAARARACRPPLARLAPTQRTPPEEEPPRARTRQRALAAPPCAAHAFHAP